MFRERLASFRNAFRGIGTLVATQTNARIHLLATVLVITAGLYLGVGRSDWLWLATAITIVWLAEGLNTALEFLADAVNSERHLLIAKAKDVAAAAVLIAALGAVVIGLLVLVPYVSIEMRTR